MGKNILLEPAATKYWNSVAQRKKTDVTNQRLKGEISSTVEQKERTLVPASDLEELVHSEKLLYEKQGGRQLKENGETCKGAEDVIKITINVGQWGTRSREPLIHNTSQSDTASVKSTGGVMVKKLKGQDGRTERQTFLIKEVGLEADWQVVKICLNLPTRTVRHV